MDLYKSYMSRYVEKVSDTFEISMNLYWGKILQLILTF